MILPSASFLCVPLLVGHSREPIEGLDRNSRCPALFWQPPLRSALSDSSFDSTAFGRLTQGGKSEKKHQPTRLGVVCLQSRMPKWRSRNNSKLPVPSGVGSTWSPRE